LIAEKGAQNAPLLDLLEAAVLLPHCTDTVHGRDATRGVQTMEEIQLQGGSARFVGADLADATSIARFAREVGDIDIPVSATPGSRCGDPRRRSRS
jgi:hypothetical protein